MNKHHEYNTPTGASIIIKKLMLLLAVTGMAIMARADIYIAYIKMPDGTVEAHKIGSVPAPGPNSVYHLHLDDGRDMIIHASNVWFITQARTPSNINAERQKKAAKRRR